METERNGSFTVTLCTESTVITQSTVYSSTHNQERLVLMSSFFCHTTKELLSSYFEHFKRFKNSNVSEHPLSPHH